MNAAATMIPTAATPIERILAGFDREAVENFIAVAIGLLDALDGDPDAEETDLEDSFALSPLAAANGPGCPIADSDLAVDDSPIDEADEGDREEDHSASMPMPDYGADQRAVIGRAGRIAFRHE